MSSVPQIKVAATYMRGGTSKGVFLNLMIYLRRLAKQVRRVIIFTACDRQSRPLYQTD